MIKLLSRFRQTIYAFLSNVIYTFSIWFIAVLINYFSGAETLGQYSFIQAIIAPLALFFHLQLKVLATLELKIKEKFSRYISIFILSESFFLIVVLLIGVILKQPILFYAFALFKVFESLNWLLQGYYQSKDNFYKAFLIALSRSIIVLLIVWIVLKNNFALYTSFLAISLGWFLLSVFYDLKKVKEDKCEIRILKKFELLKPLIFSGASLSVISSFDALIVAIPRYFIKWHFDDIELGKFTMVLQFFIASTIFVISVGHPFLVKLKHHLEKKEINAFTNEIKKTGVVFLFFSVLTILFFLITGKFIMKIVWGKEYEYLSKYLVLSMLGIVPLFLSSIFVYAINALRYFSIHLKYYPLIIISTLLFSWLFIPKFGLLGGIITIIATQTIRMISTYIALRICLKQPQRI